MSAPVHSETSRRVVASTSVSIDGFTSGRDGPEHDMPASQWQLAETTTLAHGAVGLHWRRA